MRWTERQRAMLEEIGVRLWLPPDPVGGGAAATEVAESAPDASTAAIGAVPGAQRSPVRGAAAPLAVDRSADRRSDAELAPLDWPALAARAAACTACALCAGRTHSVFGGGSGGERADWLIVGDAPDDDDDRSGEPFAGRAGQLLDNMLAAIALTRGAAPPSRRVCVTLALKCHPPGNRNPEADEIERCAPFLHRQIEIVRPRVILAMGRVAAQSLLRSSDATTKLRGRVHRYAGVPVVVTYHPAYLLRQPQDKARAWDDLCLALEVANEATPA
ncbi:MAG: uracil-DNA glycosylase [Caldimonas sp.]